MAESNRVDFTVPNLESRSPGGPDSWPDLMRRCAGGDQRALSTLYDESSSLVHAIVLKILPNPADAEEITIDVFNQVWRTASSYQPSRGTVTAWLVMLARSRAIDRVRSRAIREQREEPIFEYADFAASAPGPEEETAAMQKRRRILAAMSGLSSEQRRAVELAFFSGLSHSELAEHLDLPLGTVKTRLRSSIIRLRESLTEYA